MATALIVGGFTGTAQATTYYVAPPPTGNDSAAGGSTTPFATVQKCANVALAGDVCRIRTGTYPETVTLPRSGTSSNPIVFEADTGATPRIDGTDPLTGWGAYSGNIYRASVVLNSSLDANQVFVSDDRMTQARWPDTGPNPLYPTLARAQASTTQGTVVDSNIPTISGGWTGARIHIWGGAAWMSNTGTVTGQPAGQITYSGANGECAGTWSYLCAEEGDLYYLEGKLAALTQAREWYYDSASDYLYLWAPSGTSPTNVRVKQRKYGFDLSGRSYIQLKNIELFGASILTSATSTNNLIQGITANFVSEFDSIPIPVASDDSVAAAHLTTSGIILNGSSNTLKDSKVTGSAGNGVSVQGTGNTVTNNLIRDVNYMGTWGAGVWIRGQDHTVTYNTIYDTGRDGITGKYLGDGIFSSPTTDWTGNTIAYNNVFAWGHLNWDTGGLYICCKADGADGSIHHNEFHDSARRDNNADGGVYPSGGLYPDAGSKNMLIHHNDVWNAWSDGLHFNGDNSGAAQNLLVYNNTLGNGQAGSISTVCCSWNSSGSVLVNNILRGSNGTTFGTNSSNTTSGTDPLFTSVTSPDLRLQSSSPAIDVGTTVAGVTDGYAGTAPDRGAHEHNGSAWVSGCSMIGCWFPRSAAGSIDDAVTGTGSREFEYSGWTTCTVNCNSTYGTTFFGSTVSYSGTTDATATFRFSGRQVQIYGMPAAAAGVGAISIDGGPEVLVDWYGNATRGNYLVWTSPVLASGSHTLTVRVTGTKRLGSANYINIDRVIVVPDATTDTSVDGATTGSGLNQWTFSGASWGHCSVNCNATFGTTFHNGTISYSNGTDNYAYLLFEGTKIKLYGAPGSGGGVGAIKLDDRAEQNVTWYAPGGSQGNTLLWTSPDLPWGVHSLKVRVTGTAGAGGSAYVNVDRAVVTAP